ncbi:MAG: molybdopterin molybdotransferase MoeA [Alphaproteobacteria bacterium]|jgi:molybdopterin molybdotransferase|nr:molybdopterin molybdotransferase MoeA [Alphaproteobacteria bacterium]
MSPSDLLPVPEAKARIRAAFDPVPLEWVGLTEAGGRILAEPLAARRTQPPVPMSAMDGYAARHQDATAGATLDLVGAVAAGGIYEGTVGPGETVRIFTGAALPDGADTVVIQENVSAAGSRITINEASRAIGANVRKAGIDFREGDTKLQAGTRLGARHVALAAAMGHAFLPVRRRPRIALLATGDELRRPGDALGPTQIVASNAYGLAALVRACGAEPVDLGIARDDRAVLARAAAGAVHCDLLVTIGGASVGEHDLIREVLGQGGAGLDFWKIAMRPGKPLMFGETGGTRLLGLPGNPVSALVCGLLFLTEAIAGLLGTGQNPLPMGEARLGADLPENDRREDYLRATLTRDEAGRLVATAFARQDSSMLSTLADADCFIVRPPGAPAAAAGVPVPILDLGGGAF